MAHRPDPDRRGDERPSDFPPGRAGGFHRHREGAGRGDAKGRPAPGAVGAGDQGVPAVPVDDPAQGAQVRPLHRRPGRRTTGISRSCVPMSRSILCAATAALLVFLASATASADEVRFKNGDRLTGTITSAEGGKLKVTSKVAGDVTVDLKDVDT